MSTKTINGAVLTALLATGALARTVHAQVEMFPERGDSMFVIISGDLSNSIYRHADPVFVLRPSQQNGSRFEVFPDCFWSRDFGRWECNQYVLVPSPSPAGLWNLEYPDGELILEFEVGAWFQRGDANADSAVNISDAVSILGYLFLGNEQIPCVDAADTNDSDEVDISDAVWLLQFLFLGAAAPPPPFGECYYDAPDALTCECYPTACEGPDPDPSFSAMITILMGWGLSESAAAGIANSLMQEAPCGSQ